MDRRVLIGGGIVVAALAVVGVRSAMNTGAKSGLDSLLTHLPPGITVTHGDVSYNGLTGEAHIRDLGVARDGVPVFAAGEVSVSGIGALDASGTPQRIGEIIMHDVTSGPATRIAKIDLTGLALANLRQVIDPAFYPGGKPAWTEKRTILEHGTATGLVFTQTGVPGAKGQVVDVKFTIGGYGFDGLRLSQLPAPPDATAAPLGVIAAIETHMSYDSNTGRDADFSVSGPSQVSGHFGVIKSGAFDNGRLSDMTLGDFSMTTGKPAGTITIASMALHGFDMSKMLAMMPEIAASPNTPHPEALNGMSLARGEMSGMKIDYPAGPLVTMDTLSGVGATGPDDKTGTFSIHGFTVQTSGRPLSAAARQSLADFGMADFTTDLDEAGAYDQASGTMTLKRCDIAVHDVGALHIAAVISGLPPGGAATTPQEIQARLAQARLVSASFTWDDVSLVTRLLKMAAAKQGVSPEQIRAGLALPLASLPMLMPEQPDAAEQINAFLDGRHKLTVTLSPPAPVGMADLQTTPAPQKAALLGVKISGN